MRVAAIIALVFVATFISCAKGRSAPSSRRKLIIDTDPGVDDTTAILLVNSFTTVDILAFTTVKGTDKATQGAANLNRFKRLTGSQVPVYIGSEANLMPESDNAPDASYYHGMDGFGDVPNADPPAQDTDFTAHEKMHGVDVLIELTKKYPGEITILAIGPHTNIAAALRKDPSFAERVKDMYVMGGTMSAKGNIFSNVSLTAEYNFWRDPEAAQIVLDQMKCPMTILSWEISLDNLVDWDWYDKFTGYDTKISKFLKQITAHSAQVQKESIHKLYDFADEFAAGACMDESMILQAEEHFATVETKGYYTRGQMVIDWNLRMPANVRIVTKYDIEKLKARFLNVAQMKPNTL